MTPPVVELKCGSGTWDQREELAKVNRWRIAFCTHAPPICLRAKISGSDVPNIGTKVCLNKF